MTDVASFPGLAGLTCQLYDDSYITGLIADGAAMFQKYTSAPSTEGHFPQVEKKAHGLKYIDAEVGDDMLVVTNNESYAQSRVMVLHKDMDMRISWKDTSINEGIGNFAESLLRVPRNYCETWLSQKSLSREQCLGFIDTPKIRTMLPVRSMRTTWSSTDIGKFTDMGKVTQWIGATTPYYGTTVLASLMQDALLGAMGRRQCVYMPTSFGGAGKRVPFDCHGNLIRFLKTWKCGRYGPLMTTVIKQANRFLQTASVTGRKPIVPKALEYFTKYEPVFTDWIKDERSILAHRAVIPCELDVHKAGTIEYGDTSYWVLPRLLAEGHLVSETKVGVAIQHNELSKALVSTETFPEFRKTLERVHANWRESSKLDGNLIKNEEIAAEIRLMNGDELREADIHRFLTSVRTVREFRRLVTSERVYWPRILDDIYRHGPMVVKGLHCSIKRDRNQLWLDTWKSQADMPKGTEYYPDLEDLVRWAHSPEGNPPRGAIEDDHILELECGTLGPDEGVIIVTDDVRLCRRIAFSQGRNVLRFPVEFYYRLVYFGDGIESYIETLRATARFTSPWAYKEDTGSIQSGEERYFKDGEMYPSGAPHGVVDHNGPFRSRLVWKDQAEGLDWDHLMDPPINFPWKFMFSPRRKNRSGYDFTRG